MSLSLILAGLITGTLLGIFGSGGSIITTPALLYLLNVEPKSAIAMSLGIVAVTASLTALQHALKGNVNLKVTAIFSLFGVVGAACTECPQGDCVELQYGHIAIRGVAVA